MNTAFNSWSAFFAMGGYAFYVWFAVVMTLFSLAGLLIHTWWQRKQLLAAIRRQVLRDQRIRQAQQTHSSAAKGVQEKSL